MKRYLFKEITNCRQCPYFNIATIREPPAWCSHKEAMRKRDDTSLLDIDTKIPKWCPLPKEFKGPIQAEGDK
jgi:hypothetical protein